MTVGTVGNLTQLPEKDCEHLGCSGIYEVFSLRQQFAVSNFLLIIIYSISDFLFIMVCLSNSIMYVMTITTPQKSHQDKITASSKDNE